MAIHYTIWIPAVSLGYGFGVVLLLYGLEKVRLLARRQHSNRLPGVRRQIFSAPPLQDLMLYDVTQTSGLFSGMYRSVFGRHVGGDIHRMSMDKQPSTELIAEALGTKSSDDDNAPPREIALVPIPSMDVRSDNTPRLRSMKSKTDRYETEDPEALKESMSGLKSLQSLRSTLSAAVESFRATKEPLATEDEQSSEDDRTNKGIGAVWVRGCKCEVPYFASSEAFCKVYTCHNRAQSQAKFHTQKHDA